MIPFLLAVVCAAGGPAAPAADPAIQRAPAAQSPVQAQAPRGAAPADRLSEAYYQFMLARRLDNNDDVDGAIKAYKAALALDPAAASVRADLATLLARQGRVAEARAEAEAGLASVPEHAELHRLLGMIAAEDAKSDDEQASSTPAAQAAARKAIDHLERALKGASYDLAPGIRLAIGRLSLQTKDYDKAIAGLKQLLVDEPGFAQGVAMLAEAYRQAGRPEAAIDVLRDAAGRDPMFYGSLADAYEKAERWTDAADAYAQAAAINPRDHDLKIHWALSLLNTGRPDAPARARDLLLDVTRVSPGNGWALYLLARAQRLTGDLDGAEASARRLLVLSPASVSGAHVLAQVLAEKRAFPAVIETIAPVVDKLPAGRDADRALLLTHLGFAYLETNRLADAVASFRRAMTLNSDDNAIVAYFGQALNTAHQFDEAIELMRKMRSAKRIDPRFTRVEADALRGKGKVDDGAALLKALVETTPPAAAAYQALGEYWAAASRYAEAAAVLGRAVQLFPQDTDVRFQYAAMLERQKRAADAERAFREVIAAEPDHGPALNYLGYMLSERPDRLAEALDLVKRAVALDPHNGAYLDSLGWIYVKLGRLDEAEPLLRRAADQLPRDSVVQDHWGDLLARRGRTADAVEAWKKSLAGDGESIDRAAIERKIRQAPGREPRP